MNHRSAPHQLQDRSLTGLPARLYPELKLVVSRDERHRIFKQAERRLFRSVWAWIVAIPGTVGFVLALHYGKRLLLNTTSIPSWVAQAGVLICVLVYIFLVSTFAFVKRMRGFMRDELIAMGIPVCLHCGYDLRGQTEARCPECGEPFDGKLINSTQPPAVGSQPECTNLSIK